MEQMILIAKVGRHSSIQSFLLQLGRKPDKTSLAIEYDNLNDGDDSVGVPHGAVPAPLEQDRGYQVRALVSRLGQAVGGPLGPGEIHRVESAMRSGIRHQSPASGPATPMLAISDIRGQSHHLPQSERGKEIGSETLLEYCVAFL